jgi:hypothetical protein
MRHLAITTALMSLMIVGCFAEEPNGEVEAPVTTSAPAAATAATWHLNFGARCDDTFQRFCSPIFPSPQCPTAVAGQPCTSAGTSCFKVLPPGRFFQSYTCQ